MGDNRNRNIIIAVVIILLLCCCCSRWAVFWFYGDTLFGTGVSF
jgi:hypothetical protein